MDFLNSQSWLTVAQKRIPLGAQTFSKSITQFPPEISPLFCSHGKDGRIWDIDGNCFVDLISGLASVTLGYANNDVNEAVIKQLSKGVTFSLSTKLELEVADLISSLVPSAEMVRFAKNGSDVTSAAIRLSRAFTRKEIVLSSGYHGWHDWYVGTTSMNLGVPTSVQGLTDTFQFNSIESFENAIERHRNQIAAVIVEPIAAKIPDNDFIQHLRIRTLELGIVLIFDEIVTGFRVAPGGAQELLNVTPDLTCLGKGIANGFPLSALVGKKELMQLLSKVFFSGTFGGETLSLAAAKVVLNKVKNGSTKELASTGRKIREKVEGIFENDNFRLAQFSGHDSWLFLLWNVEDTAELQSLKTLFMQEMISNGVLILSSHNVMTSHNNQDIEMVESAYKNTVNKILEAFHSKKYEQFLRSPVIKPLFSVRGN